MSETLCSVLKLLGFDSHPQLGNDMFKKPNKKLFHKIFCFLIEKLQRFPEVDKFIELYGVNSCMSGKVEAHYRMSIIDIVNKLKLMYPQVPVKPIGQSYLMVPQGIKIITFLTDMCKVVFCVNSESEDVYQVPTTNEELDHFFNLNNCVEAPDQLNCILKELGETVKSINLNHLHDEFITFVENLAIEPNMKEKFAEFDVNEGVIDNLKQLTNSKISLLQSNMMKYEQLKLDAINLSCNLSKLKEINSFSLDGLEILDAMGFKSAASCSIDGQEITDGGKLNFESFIKISIDRFYKVNNSSYFEKVKDLIKEIQTLSDIIDREYCDLNDKVVELCLIEKKYDTLVDSGFNEINSYAAKLQHPSYLNVLGCTDKEFSVCFDCRLNIIHSPVTELPVSSDKLIDWLSEDLPHSHLSSVEKGLAKSFRSTPKLGRKSVAQKLDIFKGRKFDRENYLPVKFGLQPLIGFEQDRRATLASPMARKERFKIKHVDQKREPLRPMKCKVLFPTSSSPINEFKEVFSCGNESMINNASDGSSLSCNKDIPLSSNHSDLNMSDLALGCGFYNHLGENQLDLSKEVLKWGQSSSDESDTDLAVDFPTHVNEQSLKTRDSSTTESTSTSPELNDSTKMLILKFNQLKKSLSIYK